jgi:hypothetical protein
MSEEKKLHRHVFLDEVVIQDGKNRAQYFSSLVNQSFNFSNHLQGPLEINTIHDIVEPTEVEVAQQKHEFSSFPSRKCVIVRLEIVEKTKEITTSSAK